MVLPVHDLNPLRRTPWVTYFLVAANVVVLLLTPGSQISVTGTSSQAQLCSQPACRNMEKNTDSTGFLWYAGLFTTQVSAVGPGRPVATSGSGRSVVSSRGIAA